MRTQASAAGGGVVRCLLGLSILSRSGGELPVGHLPLVIRILAGLDRWAQIIRSMPGRTVIRTKPLRAAAGIVIGRRNLSFLSGLQELGSGKITSRKEKSRNQAGTSREDVQTDAGSQPLLLYLRRGLTAPAPGWAGVNFLATEAYNKTGSTAKRRRLVAKQRRM